MEKNLRMTHIFSHFLIKISVLIQIGIHAAAACLPPYGAAARQVLSPGGGGSNHHWNDQCVILSGSTDQ